MHDADGLRLTDQELRLLTELVRVRVPFMIVGLASAVVQGADVVTQDIDLWFESTTHYGVQVAARKAGGVFAWRMEPPCFIGQGLEDVDVVLNCSGLGDFHSEYLRAVQIPLEDDLWLRVLPLDRVIVSKRAANRSKDRAVIPALEAALAVIKERGKRRIP